MVDHKLWVERYRPKTIEDLVLTDDVRKKVNQWIVDKDIPHLLLAGDAGVGKSTLAMILRDSIAGEDNSLTINASSENSVDTIRTKIMNFSMCQSFGGLKICLMEEADRLSPNAQDAMRKVLEDYSKHTRFILTCNHPDRIEPAIKSRCQSLSFMPFTRNQMLIRLATIMANEDVSGTKEQLELIIDSVGTDMRAAINKLQFATIGGELNITKEMLMNSDIKFKIVKMLNNKDMTGIRQLIQDEMVKDFLPLYKFMFDNAKDIKFKDQETCQMIVGDFLYRDALIGDKEINFARMCLEIMK